MRVLASCEYKKNGVTYAWYQDFSISAIGRRALHTRRLQQILL